MEVKKGEHKEREDKETQEKIKNKLKKATRETN